jgi:hypothetical protein
MRWTVLALVVACRFDTSGLNEDALRGACPGQVCECRDTETCGFTCETEPCDLTCERLVLCEPRCGVDCQSRCSHVEACALSCGDGCSGGCDSSGDCQVECGHNCEFECSDVGRCRVTMLDGRARCQRAGECDIRCLGADGAAAAARPEVDGWWVCSTRSPSPPLSGRPDSYSGVR